MTPDKLNEHLLEIENGLGGNGELPPARLEDKLNWHLCKIEELIGQGSGSSSSSGNCISFVIVNALPQSGESGVIYLIPKKSIFSRNKYDEYIWVDNDFEYIGAGTFEPTDYATKTDLNSKQNLLTFNATVPSGANVITLTCIKDGDNYYVIPASGSTIDWSDIANKPAFFSGNYNDLSNKPELFSGDYLDLDNKPELFSGSYTDLTDKPELFSGSYNDLTDKPTLFSGSYNDLEDKPELFSGSYNDLADKPELFSGSYDDLTDKPTIPADTGDLTNNVGFITGIDSTDVTTALGYTPGTSNFSGSYNDLSNKPSLFSGSYTDLTDKPTLFSGSYDDLTDKPTIPANTSDLNNDAGFLSDVSWDDVASKPTFATVATSGSYDDLDDKPTIPAAISDLLNDSGYLTSVSWSDIDEKPTLFSGAYSDLIGKPTLGTAAEKAYTTSVTENSSDLVTSGAVYAAIDALPDPMLFKGTVGTGGTVEWANLPSAAASNNGFTYKVITKHTTAPICEVGDAIISNGTSWVIIPSGDEEIPVLDVQVNGSSVVSSNVASITVPTNTNELTNGAGFITSSAIANIEKTPLVSTTPGANITIDPFKVYNFGTLTSSVAVSLGTTGKVDNYCTEYCFRFTAGANCGITLPNTCKFSNGNSTPTFVAGHVYEYNIVDDLVVIGEFF